TGQDLPDLIVYWGCRPHRGAGFGGTGATYDAKRHDYWFLAPPHGLLNVRPAAAGYPSQELDLELPDSGALVREIRLSKAVDLVVHPHLDGKPYTGPTDHPVLLTWFVVNATTGVQDGKTFTFRRADVRDGVATFTGPLPG